MAERWISLIVAIAAIGLGVDNIINERGSHIFSMFSRQGPHYTGIAAIAEGIIFIACGCALIYRVWAKRDQSTKR
jgi:hypothetical protein